MNIGIIIQARMSSSRFPGKSLHTVCGKPMLMYLIESVMQCKYVDKFVIATSYDKTDDQINEFCTEKNIECYRGELQDVSKRFMQTSIDYNFDAFVRVTGDSPLLDWRIIDNLVSVYRQGDYDFVSNVLPRSFPKGQSVEVLNTKKFIEAYNKMKEPDDFEHVTAYFHKNNLNYKFKNLLSGKDLSKVQLSVDTKDDMESFTAIINAMGKFHWEYTWEEIYQIYLDTKKK